MKNNIELSIVVVNYCKYELTSKCVNSAIENIKNIEYEILIIDNNSPNESYNLLHNSFENFKRVKVIKNDNNIGFGGANNLAVSELKGEYILFLNPDVIVFDNSIQEIYKYMKLNQQIGIIGTKLLNGDKTLQYSCRRILDIKDFLTARTPLSKFISKSKVDRLNNLYLMKDCDHDKIQEVDWVMGSCILIRKDDFVSVGGFSPEYFMYFEDVDLCYKITKFGKKVIYYPKASMIHLHEQQSTKKINKLTFIHFKSMLMFYKKYRK